MNGQDKCIKCGSTDISYNIKTCKLRCNYCRYEFDSVKIENNDISNLEGNSISAGASDIVSDADDIITLKCSSCGSEVVIDTTSSTQARCHWCRNTLSINEQVPNGAVPDMLLPFKITKEEAKTEIEKFVNKRKFYANTTFKNEFKSENIMGVFFPYMVVDLNTKAKFAGEGEHLVRRYTVGTKENRRTYYDADLYNVEREFDLLIDDLIIESNSDKLNNDSLKTNNIINSILPFDTENCIKYNSNYLKGYSSEKRDTNVDILDQFVLTKANDVARMACNKTLEYYDRGVKWNKEDFKVIGKNWKAAYLPVWLYSYYQKDKNLLHYIAVNARTKEIMGSVPINQPKLILFSLLVELFGFLLMFFIDFDYNFIFLSLGFIYYFLIYNSYRNKNARHNYEFETKNNMYNLVKKDQYIKQRKGLSNSRISGENNYIIKGVEFKIKKSNDNF